MVGLSTAPVADRKQYKSGHELACVCFFTSMASRSMAILPRTWSPGSDNKRVSRLSLSAFVSSKGRAGPRSCMRLSTAILYIMSSLERCALILVVIGGRVGSWVESTALRSPARDSFPALAVLRVYVRKIGFPALRCPCVVERRPILGLDSTLSIILKGRAHPADCVDHQYHQ
ncbi:hypothetical protein K466DRAFT_181753 [Polyporus arcularius HHB13444]|uniref:Uncharacterized protein n=1 Tax=Polyporus arcularius HHB13444 TaxID=1314778 RepID=A0A5C3Q383_9APHY|nr:hypothetical protein K466DRAFT_181753 [Polyporus arcularius HHB13444]